MVIQPGNIIAAPLPKFQILNAIIIIKIKLFNMILINEKGSDPDELRTVFITLSVI